MHFYLVKFSATINEAVSKDGMIRIAGIYSQYNAIKLISQYFYNKYFSNRVAIVIKEKKEVTEEDYIAALKESINI